MIDQDRLIGRGWSFPLRVNGAGGISVSSGTNEIEEAIVLILGTSLGERVMRPLFGCRIHELVFHPLNDETIGLARRYVEEALAFWEPRITVIEVRPVADHLNAPQGRMLINIRYQVRATKDERTLVYPFYVIREE